MPNYTVTLEIQINANSPLEAAKEIAKWLKEDSDTYIYDVVNDDDANEKFTVDLSEDDEDAVLPNND